MTNYQILIDTLNTHLFKMWQNGYNQQAWNEENAKEIAHTILYQVETFKKRQAEL